MASRPAQLLNHLRRLPPAADVPGDAELLGRFARDRNEGAFAALVTRHGPMVLRVCRRLLADAPSADDAFQAVFLVLARRAGSLRHPEALAGWLHGVARRVALRARAAAVKPRRVTAGDAGDAADASPDPLSELTARELLDALDEEVARLPETYRLPLILCYLEGHSRDEAARLLGWAPGSVKGRLERARVRLHDRLTRRGLTLPALLLTPLGVATVPAALAAATAKTAIALAAGKPPAGAAAELARPFLGARAAGKWRLLAVLVLTAGLLTGYLPSSGEPPPEKTVARPDRPATDSGPPIAELPLPAGATARLGSLRWKHPARVGAVAFAPAGDALASASDDGTVILWDSTTGLPKHRLGWVRYNGGDMADCLAFSPNGKILADGRQDYMGMRPGWTWPRVSLVDTASGREVRSLWKTLDGSVRSVAFSPDNNLVAAADDAGAVRVWDATGGKERFKLAPLKGVSWKLAFAPDSKKLFLGRRPSLDGFSQPCPGEVHFWDLGTGKRGRLLVAHPKYAIEALAVSPDNRTLGVLAGYKAALFDTATGKKLRELLPKKDVRSLVFAPDARTVALGCDRPGPGARGTIWLLDAATGKGRVLAESFASTLAFSADGKLLAAGGQDFAVRLWAVATGKPVAPTRGHGDAVTCVGFAPDGQTVISAAYGGTVSIWDATTGAERLRRQPQTDFGSWSTFGYCAGFDQVGITPGGKVLAARSPLSRTPGQRQDRTVLWDVRGSKALLQVAPLERARGATPVCTVSFSPDGKAAASGEFESVVLWDVTTGKERRRLRGRTGNVYATRFSQDGRTLATYHNPDSESRDRNDRILLWDVATGKARGRISGRMLMTFALSPDGKVCATGNSSLIHLWDVATGKMLRTITTPVAPVHCLAFSPDGRLLASGDTVGGLFLCDPASGEEVLRASGHQGAVTALAFAGDRRLASASLDTTVLVWDLSALALTPAKANGASSAENLEQAWDDLAREAKAAYRAHWLLRSAPAKALALLRQRLTPAATPSKERLHRLIAELDNDKFAARERATQELAQLGTAAETSLRDALKGAPTLELRKRVMDLLGRLKTDVAGERRRALRGILLLERIGTRQARSLLERLAGGTPDAPETREAKIALERLRQQPSR